MNIITLTAAHAPRYRTLMLEAYTLAADAYTSTAQDRAREPDTWWVHRVADAAGLTVTEGNATAIAMYAAAGFQTWGTQPRAIATPSGVKGKVHMSRRLHGDEIMSGLTLN